MAHLLLLEDDKTFSTIINGFLSKHGHVLELCPNVSAAVNAFRESLANHTPFDALLLDYNLPDGNAMDFLKAARAEVESTSGSALPPSIIMTSVNDIRTAILALRSGVLDYITKPVHPDELLQTLKETLAGKDTPTNEAGQTTKSRSAPPGIAELVRGTSPAAQKLYKYVDLVGPTDMSVIIQGESGVGKEHIARAIHNLSPRKSKPFVAIDCGALSNELATSEFFGYKKGAFTGAVQDKIGQFEMANGGTLFLDEIGNLSYEIQIKLLRVIQERVLVPVGGLHPVKIDVRIIVATNYDLLNGAQSGEFREDLYHRLNEFKIYVPPLRERAEDLGSFIQYFIDKTNYELKKEVTSFSPELMSMLIKYEWPGNLRELSNVIKRLILLTPEGEMATLEGLPEDMRYSIIKTPPPKANPANLRKMQEEHEREMITSVLHQVKFNKSKAARILQIDRKTLYYKLEKYQIS
jgi:two-component system response regulator HydG